MTLTLVTPPAAEPVGLADMKAFLKVETDAEDTLIGTLVAAARLHVEAATRRVLVAQGWRLSLDGWPPRRLIELPLSPVIAVDAVKVKDGEGGVETLTSPAYAADTASQPARLLMRQAPVPGAAFNGIEIEFTAGYGETPEDVPAPLRQAVRLLVAHWHENREPVAFGGAPARLPLGIEALLAPYRAVSL